MPQLKWARAVYEATSMLVEMVGSIKMLASDDIEVNIGPWETMRIRS